MVHWEDWYAESAFILLLIRGVRDELIEHLEPDLASKFCREVLEPKSICKVLGLILTTIVKTDMADIGCSGYESH